ncbi:hypothetical protein [Amycolatopsis lexingtonensis]|uniref:hypothetical protein n=1 Tax=Amycolatopsis lexingtonensis TaxID=218822 RepID=UPI003F7082BE
MTGRAREDPEGRAAFRAFVRAHHPDVGGDPAEFAAGLARFREPADDSRFDAPVSFVRRRRGLAALVSRFRRRPPRVR